MYGRAHEPANQAPRNPQTRQQPLGPSPFGLVLKREREAAGLSIAELAARGDVSARAIEYLEKGQTQQAHRMTRERLARGLGLVGPVAQRFIDGPYERGGTAPPARHNLPNPLTTFVARTHEADDLRRLLEGRPRRHLVTIWGPGGIGKTRLALAVATTLRERFPGGSFLIDLTQIAAGETIEALLATVLEVRDDNPTALGEMIIGRLRQQRTLLVFDNCEHLLASCAALIARLLAGAPQVQIIATSREPLGLPGERVRRLDPLALPPDPATTISAADQLAAISASPAVQLFVERARLVATNFTLARENAPAIAAICRRLDGLPLPIELAASRLIDRPVDILAAELATALNAIGGRRGVHKRQRTVRAMVDWSYALLNDAERTLLRRVAVFPGSWTTEAASAVCGDSRTPDLPGLLDSLVAKSLVQEERASGEMAAGPQVRYYLLQTIRHHALEQLQGSGEAAANNERLYDWTLTVLESAESPLDGGPEGTAWLDRVGAELPNLRAARAWAADHDPPRALRLLGATWPYAFARLGHDVGRHFLRQALAAVPEPSPWRMAALQGLGFLELFNDLPAARRYLTEALHLAEAAGATERLRALRWQLAFACITAGDLAAAEALLARGWPAVEGAQIPTGRRSPYQIVYGYLAIARGDFPTARERLQAASDEAREADQPLFLCIALSRLGALYIRYGYLADATARYTELLALADRLGSWFYRFIARAGLAHVQEWQGAHVEAVRGYDEALSIAIEAGGSRLDRATVLLGKGRALLRQGRFAEALALLQEGDALARALNHRSLVRDFAAPLGFALWYTGQIGLAARQLAAALADNVQGDPTTLAHCLDGIAFVAIAHGAPVAADTWLAATATLRETIGMVSRPNEQTVRGRARQLLRERGGAGSDPGVGATSLEGAIAAASAWLAQVAEDPQAVAAD